MQTFFLSPQSSALSPYFSDTCVPSVDFKDGDAKNVPGFI